MFGLGFRGKNEEVKKLRARGLELEHELGKASQSLADAESRAATVASTNRVLAAKVHRLALQRAELQNDRDRVLREHRELQLSNLRLEEEARAAKAAGTDMWQVTKLQAALRQQAAQHETKMTSLKRRTKALLTAVLPGSHVRAAASAGGAAALPSPSTAAPTAWRDAASAPGSPSLSEAALPDLWDVPLSPPRLTDMPLLTLGADAGADAEADAHAVAPALEPDVNSRIRQIVGWLYDDTLSEDAALEHITLLAQGLALTQPQPQPTDPPSSSAVQSRGCSPLPPPSRRSAAASDKVDAATGTQTARVRHVADAATETPALMSYLGSPSGAAATPSEPGGSPRRMGFSSAVPPLNLAALVAEAMQAAPMSSRSNASTTAGGGGGGGAGSSASFISQFVLAQPEKLQRLIMRHAAATAAKAGLPPPAYSAHAAQGGHLGSGAAGMDHHGLGMATYGSAGGTDTVLTARGGSMTSRLTGRLLGLGIGSSAANASHATAAPVSATSGSSSAAAGVVLPGGPSHMTTPSKGAKRMNSAPKFAMLDGPPSHVGAAGPKAPPAAGRQAGAPELRPLWGGSGGASSNGDLGAGGRIGGGGLLVADLDDWPTFGSGGTTLARSGGAAR